MDLNALQAALDAARSSGDYRPLEKALMLSGWMRLSATREEIRARVSVNPDTGCWEWTGSINAHGYGEFGGRGAHRLSWEAFKGPIPQGYHIDHVCRVRNCVRPDVAHLEPVTPEENNRRAMAVVQESPDQRVHHGAKRWCSKGHEYTEDNTWRDKRGRRYCLTCRRDWSNISRRRAGKAPRSYVERHVDEELWAQLRSELPPAQPTDALVNPTEAAKILGYNSVMAMDRFRSRHRELLRPAVPSRPPLAPGLYRLVEVELLRDCQSTDYWTKKSRQYPTTASAHYQAMRLAEEAETRLL